MSETESHLIALGVPRHVAAYVAEQNPLRIDSFAGWGVLVVMLAGFAVGAAWLWPTLEAQLEHNARTAAEASGALLYYHNFGIGLLIALFAWIGFSGFIVGVIPMLSKRLTAGSFYSSVAGAATAGESLSARAARWGVEKMLRQLEDESDPERYIHRAVFGWVRPAFVFAFAALALSAAVTFREINAYTLYFADRYEEKHTFIPSPTLRRWDEVLRVEVGCNHVTGRNASDDPIYQVHFRDGGSTRIDGAFPLRGSWVSEVEQIDARIVAAGAQFEPWSWLNRNPYHPRCLAMQSMMLGQEDYARLRRLIRAP